MIPTSINWENCMDGCGLILVSFSRTRHVSGSVPAASGEPPPWLVGSGRHGWHSQGFLTAVFLCLCWPPQARSHPGIWKELGNMLSGFSAGVRRLHTSTPPTLNPSPHCNPNRTLIKDQRNAGWMSAFLLLKSRMIIFAGGGDEVVLCTPHCQPRKMVVFILLSLFVFFPDI